MSRCAQLGHFVNLRQIGMEAIYGFLNVLFGCTHKKLSFPITVRGSSAA